MKSMMWQLNGVSLRLLLLASIQSERQFEVGCQVIGMMKAWTGSEQTIERDCVQDPKPSLSQVLILSERSGRGVMSP